VTQVVTEVAALHRERLLLTVFRVFAAGGDIGLSQDEDEVEDEEAGHEMEDGWGEMQQEADRDETLWRMSSGRGGNTNGFVC
jgi:hypothetical protein